MIVVSRMTLSSCMPAYQALLRALSGATCITPTLPCLTQRRSLTAPAEKEGHRTSSHDVSGAKATRRGRTARSARSVSLEVPFESVVLPLNMAQTTTEDHTPTVSEKDEREAAGAAIADGALEQFMLQELPELDAAMRQEGASKSGNANNNNNNDDDDDDGSGRTLPTRPRRTANNSSSSSSSNKKKAKTKPAARISPNKGGTSKKAAKDGEDSKCSERVKVEPSVEPEISVLLTSEQQHAVELALQRRNVFITGSAGTGKSVVLHEITRQLRARGRNVYLTATTGVAALNIRGATINSFAGTGYARGTMADVLQVVRRNRKACGRWKYCSTLIIDEVSMLTPQYLDVLNYVAKALRKRPDEPLGGVQVILCGDFLQLPPVVSASEAAAMRAATCEVIEARSLKELDMFGGTLVTGSAASDDSEDSEGEMAGRAGRELSAAAAALTCHGSQPKKYCFESTTWAELDLCTVLLHRKHRQGKDVAFQSVLDDIRVGALSKASYELLAERVMACDDAVEEYNTTASTTSPATVAGGAAHNNNNNNNNNNSNSNNESNAKKHYVRLCGTNREVNERNARFFARLAPKTDVYNLCRVIAHDAPVSQVQRSMALQPDAHNTAEERMVSSSDDGLWPLHVYEAYDAFLSPTSRPGEYTEEPVKAIAAASHNSFLNAAPARAQSARFHRTSSSGDSNKNKDEKSARSQDGWWVRFEDSPLATRLPLKIGTRVMLLHNVSARHGLVNGSVGEVAGFLHPLELVDLMLRAGRERYAPTPRGAELLARGGFSSFRDVFRCVDTAHGNQTLYYWLRHNLPGRRDVHSLSYADVFGNEHLRDLRRLTGCEVAHSETASAAAKPSMPFAPPASAAAGAAKQTNSNDSNSPVDESTLDLLDELLASSPLETPPAAEQATQRAPVAAANLYLGGLLPEQLRLMRLPIVRIDLPKQLLPLEQQQQQQQQQGGGGGKAGTATMSGSGEEDIANAEGNNNNNNEERMKNAAHKSAAAGLPHIYAYVSPHREYWYMGNRAVASRLQLPLRHAWAMTVHKAQGLTIQQLEIDMKCYNTPGQTYVALSRATSLQDIRLLNLRPECILACPVARSFYGGLEKTQ